jgi:hypothetical protein
MEHSRARPKAVAIRRKFAPFWVDVLVLTTAVLVFAVIIIANSTPARSSTSTSLGVLDPGVQTSQLPQDSGLVKARIRLAAGGPWS